MNTQEVNKVFEKIKKVLTKGKTKDAWGQEVISGDWEGLMKEVDKIKKECLELKNYLKCEKCGNIVFTVKRIREVKKGMWAKLVCAKCGERLKFPKGITEVIITKAKKNDKKTKSKI